MKLLPSSGRVSLLSFVSPWLEASFRPRGKASRETTKFSDKEGNVHLLCRETRASTEDNGRVGAAMALIYIKELYTMR